MAKALKKEDHPLSVENIVKNKEEAIVIEVEREKDVVAEIFTKFTTTKDNRDRAFKYFDGRTLVEMIDDSVGRFITNIDERDGIEDWQARVHVPMSAQKVEAVLGKVVSQLPIAQVVQRFDDDSKKASIIDMLYQYSEDVDDYDELILCAVLEGIVKGTVIGYEGYEYRRRVSRDITGENEDGTPIMKNVDVAESKLYGSIIPLEDFYPASVSIRRIEDMPFAFVRKVMPYSEFIQDYSVFPRFHLVSEKRSASQSVANEPFYKDHISADVGDGSVEVISYYNRDTDEYVVLANGTWLNPLKDFTVAPIPFNHKRLPFWSARFSTLGSDFFYGKSLVDRISSLQDVLNVLTNMSMDQSFLTIFPPVLTAGIDPIEDDYLRPGRRVPVDTQGLPLNQAFMKLDLGTPSGWHQWILQYTKSILEEASVDQTSSGQAGVGGRTTAEEIRTAAAGVAAILGVFGKLLNIGIKNKARLRVANILQFWTRKDSPITTEILGEKAGMFAEAFNVITEEDTSLSGNKTGRKVVAMYEEGNLPSKSQVSTTAKISEMKSGKKVEIIAITGDYIRKVLTDIKLVPNPKSNETRDMEKALELEWARTVMEIAPNQVNMEELLASIARVYGKDPSKVFKAEQEQQPQAEGDVQAGGDVANNMVRKMMGGQTGDMQIRDLA
jgi:hypothetical protein